MHNAAFRHLGLDYVYLPFAVKPRSLPQALRALPELGIVGVNLTIPHKEQALDYLDELDAQARLIGAVNTVKVQGGKLVGYNTDGRGFVRALRLEAGVDPAGKAVCLLGAGGSARALAVALALAGIGRLTIMNRTLERAQTLAEHLGRHFPGLKVRAFSLDRQEAARGSEIIINTTSVGMKAGDGSLLDDELIAPGSMVCDLIYSPLRTRLLQVAAERGAGVMNGLGMLLYQGALAFEIWTGRTPPLTVMRKELSDKI